MLTENQNLRDKLQLYFIEYSKHRRFNFETLLLSVVLLFVHNMSKFDSVVSIVHILAFSFLLDTAKNPHACKVYILLGFLQKKL